MIRRPNYDHIKEMESAIRIHEINMRAGKEKGSIKASPRTGTVTISKCCGYNTGYLEYTFCPSDHFAWYNEYGVGSAKPINRVRGEKL
jgi:hypothetical protein